MHHRSFFPFPFNALTCPSPAGQIEDFTASMRDALALAFSASPVMSISEAHTLASVFIRSTFASTWPSSATKGMFAEGNTGRGRRWLRGTLAEGNTCRGRRWLRGTLAEGNTCRLYVAKVHSSI